MVCPMAMGNHVDHRMARIAGENAARSGERICLEYYADVPYVLRQDMQDLPVEAEWEARRYPLSEGGIVAWQGAVAAYASQLSSFWSDEAQMRAEIGRYARQNGGDQLYFFSLTRGPCGVSSIS